MYDDPIHFKRLRYICFGFLETPSPLLSVRLHPAPDQAKAAMDACLSIFFNERDYQTQSRRAVIERICITFLLKTSATARKAFYQDQITKLMSVLEAKELKVNYLSF